MSQDFEIHFERIDGLLSDPLEQATFARLSIALGERVLSRCADRRTGVRDYVKLPLYQLALGLANHWWTLLYEPFRPEEATSKRIALHQLDAFARGYVFPSLGLWSAGAETMVVETGPVRRVGSDPGVPLLDGEIEVAKRIGWRRSVKPRALSRAQFIDETSERTSVARGDLEAQLFDLVGSVIDWIDSEGDASRELTDRWSRIVASINDPAERNYCIAAGRLGFDPYDPDAPDIGIFAAALPEESFDDLCEAVRFDELSAASAWLSQQQPLLENAAATDVANFGARPALDPTRPAWESGYRAAIALRRTLSLGDDPLQATRRLIGEPDERLFHGEAPPAVEGLLVREENCVRSLVQARSNAQWRFRKCRAAFLGWGAEPEAYPLLTTATTHIQQASRAFAAELLCPVDFLRNSAGRHGLTGDQIIDIADALDCQALIVEHQAYNHGIPTRGLD